MNKKEIVGLLSGYNNEEVERFASYCMRSKMETDRNGKLKNPWLQNRKSEEMAELFKRVANEGLVFDGVHVTLQSTGISYDYIAYKNKMFVAYPESLFDVSLVYAEDKFSFKKEDGKISYSHTIGDPFNQKDLVGGYCIIKNKRGEFITLLSKEDIDKHRKVAKTDYIWRQWFTEMALKTVIKKACKVHFSDIYQEIEKQDNTNYNLENPLEIDLDLKNQIDQLKTKSELRAFYKKHKGAKGLDKYITIKMNEG